MTRPRWAAALVSVALLAGCSQAPAPITQPAASQSTSTTGVTSPSTTSSAPPSSTAAHSTAPKPSPKPTASTPAPITALSAAARAVGLVDVRTVVPDAVVDLRYATADNFTKVRLYPLTARCLVHQTMVPGLITAAARLRAQGDLLVFWDCYRPHEVQVKMFQIVPDSNWVARPDQFASSHETGRSVDVTVARVLRTADCAIGRRVQSHCLLDMGTGFDDFTPRAHAFATYGVSAQAQADRVLLRAAMNAGGLQVYSGEWWHFDGPGALVERPQLNAPLS